MRSLAVLALAAAALMIDVPGAKAAAWCSWYDPYTYNCGFYTYAQCMANISGVGGYCARNAAEPTVIIEEPRRHRVKRRHRG